MPDILLIQPPIEDFYLTVKRTLPYGLACIAASLRQAGFSVDLLDALATDRSRTLDLPPNMAFLDPFFGRVDQSPFALFHSFRHFGFSYQHIGQVAKNSGAPLVGISSLCSAYSATALDTAVAVKRSCPRALIVMGGHHPTALPEAVIRHPAVDFVLRGDGEVSLPLLAEALLRGGSLDAVPGLVTADPKRGLINRPPAVVPDLNQTPPPAFDLVNWHHYQRNGRASVSLAAGRGCPMRCTYCAVNAVTHHGFRQKTVATVMAELDAAQAQKPLGFIDFEDEHLSADPTWFLSLLRAVEKRYGAAKPELRAMNGLYAPSLTPEIVAQMARTGFKTLNLALITTDRRQLKRYGRLDISADMDRVLALAGQYGLDAVAYVIIAGPDQDPHTAIQDLLFLAQRPVLAGVSVFYPAPGSADYQWCQNRGLLPPDPGLLRATALPLVHATSRVQTVTLLRLGRILNFIKHILDQGQALPQPRALDHKYASPIRDRHQLGRQLLAAFFKEGIIYGRDAGGDFYRHAIDPELIQQFLTGIQSIGLRGTITTHRP